jgi:hypothetical protein
LTLSFFSSNFGKPFKRLRFENQFSANLTLQGLTKNKIIFRFLTQSFSSKNFKAIYPVSYCQLRTTFPRLAQWWVFTRFIVNIVKRTTLYFPSKKDKPTIVPNACWW